MPACAELQAERANKDLGLQRLRPWDLAVDPLNRPPLRPFEQVDRWWRTRKQSLTTRPELASGFRTDAGAEPARSGQSKRQGAGRLSIHPGESRLPFIFMNAVGMQRDVETILHEAGHAFHALATREEDLYAYRGAPIEFCEVASMSMELLGNEFLEEFYSGARCQPRPAQHLEGILEIFPWIATVDAFQHWIYTHPGHTRGERACAWLAVDGSIRRRRGLERLSKQARPISGIGSCISSSIRFTTWNTASLNLARCKFGPTRSAIRLER